MPHRVDGIVNLVFVDSNCSTIDVKLVDIVHGDSGTFYHYCDITQNDPGGGGGNFHIRNNRYVAPIRMGLDLENP